MMIITFILANLVVVYSAPFFLRPNFHDENGEVKLGASIFLNKSANPCNNFYEYACGGWIEKTVKPESQPFWNHWQTVTQEIFGRMEKILQLDEPLPKYLLKARKMYNACISNKIPGITYLNNLKSLINGLHGWPMVTNSWNASRYDWAVSVAKIIRILGIHPLLKMHVFVDMQNTSQHILYIEQGELNLPQTILLKPQKYTRHLQSYQVWILETIRYLFPGCSNTNLKTNIIEMIMFETELAKLNLHKDTSKKLSIKKLIKEFPINWIQVFEQLFSFTSVNMLSNDMVIVRSPKYLTNLLILISNTKPETIGNYVIWSVVKHLSRETTNYMRKLNFMMDNIFFGVKKDLPRSQECMNTMNIYMGTALILKYSKLFLVPETITTINKMVENIKTEFIKLLTKNSWLGDATKTYAVEKIKALKYMVGYPDWLNNDTFLENSFREVNISNNHLRNVIHLKSLAMKNELEKLKYSATFEWPGSAFEVNAYYNVLQNSIFMPLGILEPPFFDLRRPIAGNYGALGSLIGHEISHALDVLGRHADKNGNIRNWWSEKDTNKYDEATSCFVQQYNKYNVDGLNTLGENIADNIGLQISYDAFRNLKDVHTTNIKQVTADQLFFISFAQVWCEISSENELTNEEAYAPVKVRVMGILHNSKEFENAFDCKVNTKKCTLW